MPITLPIQTRRISQTDFGEIAYRVMEHVFSIHNEFGRFFDEWVYKRELANRMNDIALEVPVTVSHASFFKTFSMDVLVSGSALFEFKAVETIHPRHRCQTINYLLLADLSHAKLINVRPEKVEHEFVNCQQRLIDLRSPKYQMESWNEEIPGAKQFRTMLQSLVADWGCGLELSLYEAALSHLLFGSAELPVKSSTGEVGFQKMLMSNPDVAFKLTALNDRLDTFAIHAWRLLDHLPLKAILWANLTWETVRLETIEQ